MRRLIALTAALMLMATAASAQVVKTVTASTYTASNLDCDRDGRVTVLFNNATGVTVTLPRAGLNGQFLAGCALTFQNIGVGLVTVTPATSTINGAASTVIGSMLSAIIYSNAEPSGFGNYFTNQSLDLLSGRVDIQTPPRHVSTATETDTQVRSFNKFQTNVAPTASSQNIEAAVLGFANYTGTADLTGSGHIIGAFGWAQLNAAQTAGLVIGLEGKVGSQLTGGTITNAIGVESNLYTVAGATIGNAFAFNADFANAGTLAHLVGYRCPDYSTLAVAPTDKSCARSEDAAAGFLQRNGTGGSAVYSVLAGSVASLATPQPTAGTGLEVICAGVVPGGVLKTTGDTVTIRAYFNNSATNNNKNVGLRVGANNLQTGNVGAGSNAAVSTFTATLKRTGTNTQTLIIEGRSATTNYGPSYFSTSETEANDIVIWPLAQSAVAGEITCLGHDAVYYPATQ